jgi:Arc/MetJ-type ribon-helix-helix transcriptional regulator
MSEELPRSVEVDLPTDVEAIIAEHESPDEGSVWTIVIHGALWEMRARAMGRETIQRELAEELQAALDSGPAEEATAEWWKWFRARCEEDSRRIDEARRKGLLGNLLLPDKLYDFVTAEVTAGRFASATDVVSEAVRKCSWHWERNAAAG